MIDRDKLNSLSPTVAARSTFTMLDRAQDLNPENQLIATGALLLMLCEHHGIETQDVMTVVKNLMAAEKDRHDDFTALQNYMRYEL